MQIRLATTLDFAGIIACEEQAFGLSARTGNARDISQCSTLAAQIHDDEIHVATSTTQILGYISFSPSSDHIFVDTVAVLPGHHRRGLGSRLLLHAEQAAFLLDLGSVKLFTDGSIAGNVSFYDRCGYEETGRCEEGDFSRIFYSKPIASDPVAAARLDRPQPAGASHASRSLLG